MAVAIVEAAAADTLADSGPCSVLGYRIRSRTQICLSGCVAAVLELLVYVVVLAADAAVIVQHWRDANALFAWLTALWLTLPAAVCFVTVLTSPWQWPDNSDNNAGSCDCGLVQVRFVLRQLANMVFFPVGAIYR